MIRNPIHKRMEKLASWQHHTFMACLCERMYPNYYQFCLKSGFGDPLLYRRILDLVWETLIVKEVKINFDSQLEKWEQGIPNPECYDLYGVYPAIDAAVALSELLHSYLSGEALIHAVEISKISLSTVAMLSMTCAKKEMTDEQLKMLPEIQDELDIQWEIYRLLIESDTRDLNLIKGLRADLKESGESNICIKIER